MRDAREQLLRTQAVTHVLAALGACQVNIYGNESQVGGVTLDNESQVNSRTYWFDQDGTRYLYDTTVTVVVHRREVPRAG